MARFALLLATAAVAVVLPARAAAQGFTADHYAVPMSAEDLMVTERAGVTAHLRVGAVVAADYVHAAAAPAGSFAAVGGRLTLHTAATFGLWDRFQVGVAVPTVITQSAPWSAPAVGDLRLDVRTRLAGPARGGFARMAVAASLTLPTGDPAALAGDGGVGFAPRLLVELANAGGFLLALDVGVAVRPSSTQGTLTVGDAFVARLGLTIPLARRFWITLEAFGSTALAAPFDRPRTPLESLAGLHFVSRQGFAAGLAAGPRILDGYGAADVHAVALVGYAPQAPDGPEVPGDRDLDGVADPEDQCPTEPAGPRPDAAHPGCPVRDRDHDGVPDSVDRCPDEPAGDTPDPRRFGCPRADLDGDGVPDPEDQCPTEPVGARGDPAHRGCPVRDRDDDGFPDERDECPVNPAGAHPDARHPGCPDPDPDRDGIPNERDACPDEAGPRTTTPATNGCPRVHVAGDRIVIAQQPRFAVDHDVILPASYPLLQEILEVLTARPEITRVEVQGHTDARGDAAHNLDLSQRRAASIRAWLVQRGIAEDRLVARGYGATRPAVDNATARGRTLNRRVEFVILAARPAE